MSAAVPKSIPSLPAWKVILKMIFYRKDLWLANWLIEHNFKIID